VHISQDIPYADGSNHSVDSLDTLNLDSPNKPHDKKERILKVVVPTQPHWEAGLYGHAERSTTG